MIKILLIFLTFFWSIPSWSQNKLSSIKFYVEYFEGSEVGYYNSRILDSIASIIKKNKRNYSISYIACCKETDYLRSLSSQRSRAIYSYLLRTGIDTDRVSYNMKGCISLKRLPYNLIIQERQKNIQSFHKN